MVRLHKKETEEEQPKVERKIYPEIQFLRNDDFQKQANDMDLENQKALLQKMRDNREFYKKILIEPEKRKNPGSHRYRDAEKKLSLLCDNGKYLSNILK